MLLSRELQGQTHMHQCQTSWLRPTGAVAAFPAHQLRQPTVRLHAQLHEDAAHNNESYDQCAGSNISSSSNPRAAPSTKNPGTRHSAHSSMAAPQQQSFQPKALTAGLQRANTFHDLERIWQQYQHQFNSIHFSVLMQQLAKLHHKVVAGMLQGETRQPHSNEQQKQQWQRQQRSANLAELEEELGHLLVRDKSQHTFAAGTDSNRQLDGSSSSSSPRKRKSRSRSKGLAELCPALDGYEHLVATAPGPTAQQPLLSWRGAAAKQQQQPSQRDTAQKDRLHKDDGDSSAGFPSSDTGSSKRHTQQPPSVQQLQQQLAKQQRHQQQIRSLALTVASAVLQQGHQVDHRAMVMVGHNLARMQLYDGQVMSQLLQALNADVLPQLDTQQLTNLVWSVGVTINNAKGNRNPYRLLAPPVALRAAQVGSDHLAAVAAVIKTDKEDTSHDDGSSSTRSGPGTHLGGAESAAMSSSGVPAVDSTLATPQAAAGLDTTAETFGDWPVSVTGTSSRAVVPPTSWLTAAADALVANLPACSSQGVAMALWGFAQLGFVPASAWWERFWVETQETLQKYSAQDLALLMAALGKMGLEVPPNWVSSYCHAAVEALPAMSSQQLTMCAWGIACTGAVPDKAFLLLWFLQSKRVMEEASTQELSMWLYCLSLLRVTPAPSWCALFVEVSFARFTASHTQPQDLVTAMWSIGRLGWSPPLLYWRGLMEAAQQGFSRFGPQDLANCVSAAAVVDITCMSDSWLSAFLKASRPRLSAFAPVQLAHTANALAIIVQMQPSAHRLIHAAWQEAFVEAAAPYLEAGKFSARNLCLVVAALRVVHFKPHSEVQQFLLRAEREIEQMQAQQQRQQLMHEQQIGQ